MIMIRRFYVNILEDAKLCKDIISELSEDPELSEHSEDLELSEHSELSENKKRF